MKTRPANPRPEDRSHLVDPLVMLTAQIDTLQDGFMMIAANFLSAATDEQFAAFCNNMINGQRTDDSKLYDPEFYRELQPVRVEARQAIVTQLTAHRRHIAAHFAGALSEDGHA